MLVSPAYAQQSPVTVTLDQAIQMAIQHNHSLQAARTTIQQSQAAEITANLRPNPTFFTDWEYLPVFSPPQGTSVADYLQASTEGDIGLSYLIERGKQRARRLKAAKDVTAVTRAQVADSERGVTAQVGALFINAQLAQSTLELAQVNVKGFQQTVDIADVQFKDGAMSGERSPAAHTPDAAVSNRISNRLCLPRPRRCRIFANNWVMSRCPHLRCCRRVRIQAAGRHHRRIAGESPPESSGPARGRVGH